MAFLKYINRCLWGMVELNGNSACSHYVVESLMFFMYSLLGAFNAGLSFRSGLPLPAFCLFVFFSYSNNPSV